MILRLIVVVPWMAPLTGSKHLKIPDGADCIFYWKAICKVDGADCMFYLENKLLIAYTGRHTPFTLFRRPELHDHLEARAEARRRSMGEVLEPMEVPKPKVLELIQVSPGLTAVLKAKFDHCSLWERLDQDAFLAEHGPSFRGLVVPGFSWFPIDNSILAKLPNLEIISAFSAGTNNVDKALLKSRRLPLTNTGSVHADSAGEYAVGLALSTLRKIVVADRFVRDGEWAAGASFPLTRQLCNKHVGIVGLGHIGAAVAKRMACFGCTIGYCSRSPKPEHPNYQYYDNVVELAKDCDILIAACNLTKATTKIINREVLDALGPQGFVVNVSRGPVVDESELVRALKEGRIAGAGLDVFEDEPGAPEELIQLDNCVLQPHLASATFETHRAMVNMVVANLEAHFAGQPLLTPVI